MSLRDTGALFFKSQPACELPVKLLFLQHRRRGAIRSRFTGRDYIGKREKEETYLGSVTLDIGRSSILGIQKVRDEQLTHGKYF